MTPDYDILIAGAGPAGCAAAYDLAQAGLRVLLLDKRSFPRHKACACGLTRKTLDALRYSVAPVTERLCHEIVLQQASDDPGKREVRVRTRTPICATAVRSRFDAFCLAQTLAAGRNGGAVALRKIESILALRETGDHIELDIATTDGTETLRAPVLIGADGSNGQTRRLLLGEHGNDPPWYTRGFALEATVPFSSLPRKRSPSAQDPHDLIFDFAPLPGGYGWLFPKADHINIGVGAFAPSSHNNASKLSPSAQDVTRQLLLDYTHQKLGLTPDALDHLHITGQHLGMGGHAYIPRGRVLLVGDAAGLVDPLTGEGIHSAIVSAQAAAAAILETLNPEPWTLNPAEAYARHLAPLQQTLAFSHRAAQAFYRQPERGFRAMRIPFLRSLILKTYADGLPHTHLLTALAKFV